MQEEKHRNRLKLNLIAFVGFFVFSFSAFSQVPSTIHFSAEEGLPSNETYDILQDKKGFIWICTDRGLARYDGSSFTNFNTSNSNLSNNTVFKAFPNGQKEIWFSCFDKSISIYDLEGDSFRLFRFNLELMEEWTLWSESIHFTDSIVYLYSASGGGKGDRLAYYHIEEDSLEFVDKVEQFDIKTDLFTTSFTVPSTEKRRLYRSSKFKGQFASLPDWISHEHWRMRHIDKIVEKAGDYYFGVGDELIRYSNGTLSTLIKIEANVNQVALDKQKRVVALTDRGVYVVDGSEISQRFKDYRLSGMCTDFEGNTWYTTLDDGVFFEPQSGIVHHPEIFEQLPEKNIQMLGSFKNRLFMGEHGSRLYEISRNNKISVIPKVEENLRGYPASKFEFTSMFVENDTGFLPSAWVLTEKNGQPILSVNGMHGHFRHVLPATRDKMFYAFFTGGFDVLNKVQLDTLSELQFGFYNLHLDQIPKRIISVAKTERFLWLGTAEGLWKVPFTDFDSVVQVKPRLLNVRINQIISTENDQILLATMGKGLALLNDDTLIFCTENEGLLSNLVNEIVLENDALVWVATTQGLSSVNYFTEPSLKVKRNFGQTDGIISKNITHLAICYGRLWMASNKGMYSAKLNDLSKEANRPIVYFLDCTFEGESVVAQDFLLHSQNTLLFSFQGISHRKPQSNFYRYKIELKGQEGEWILTNDAKVQLIDLPPGRYTFSVQARTIDNLWSNASSFQFRIVPQISQTAAFKIAVVLLLLTAVVVYFRRRAHIQGQQAQKESRIKDLELNSLINQMNPHFVFNSMNSLQNLIVENDQPTSLDFISNFSSLMRSSLNFSGREWIDLDEELEFITKYLNTELLRFPDRFEYKIDCDKELLNNDIQVPPLLLQPLIENSVKHAFVSQQGDGRIQVKISKQDDMIHLLLTDNGIGIKSGPTKLKNGKVDSKGTRIVEERMKIMKEKYPEHNIQFSITDLSDEPNNEKGTKVEILLPILD